MKYKKGRVTFVNTTHKRTGRLDVGLQKVTSRMLFFRFARQSGFMVSRSKKLVNVKRLVKQDWKIHCIDWYMNHGHAESL